MTDGRKAVYGILGLVLAAGLCAAAAASCYVRSSGLAAETLGLDACLGPVQSVADRIASACGELDGLPEAFPDGRLDGGVFTLAQDVDGRPYSIMAGPVLRDGYLGTCPVVLSDGAGTELWRITASWQEEAFHGG